MATDTQTVEDPETAAGYVCPGCGGERFQEVEYESQWRPIRVWVGADGAPHSDQPDYDQETEHADTASTSHVECATCLMPLPDQCDAGFEGMREALRRIAEGLPRLDDWRSSAAFMESVAAILEGAGCGAMRPDHYAE